MKTLHYAGRSPITFRCALGLASLAVACSSTPSSPDTGVAPADVGSASDAPASDVSVTSVDAPAIDASVVDVTSVDAPAIDASVVDVTTVDAPAVDAATDVTIVDVPAVDAATDVPTDVPADVPPSGVPYVAALSGAEAVPPASGVAATGSATFSLVGSTLSYTISHDVPSPTSVVLARGDAGEAGATVTLLAGAAGSVTLSEADLTALAQGRLYVAVTTASAPGGYIRAQVLQPDHALYVAGVSRFESFPRSPSATLGTASFVPLPGTGRIRYHLRLTRGTATGLTLSSAPPGYSATGVALTLDAGGTSADGVIDLGFMASNIELNRLRLHVTSADGTLVVPILRPGSTYYGGNADGSENIPAVSTGSTVAAHFVLDYSGTRLWYDVATSLVPAATGIYNAPGGVAGTRVFAVPGPQGTWPLGAANAALLRARSLHLRLDTSSRPSGELRLQIRRPGENLHSAAFGTAGITPASTSTATGGVQLVVNADGSAIHYRGSVAGLAGAVTAVELRSTGGTAAVAVLSGSDATPAGSYLIDGEITGAAVTSALPLLQGGTAAVLVRTASFPSGEVRGVPALRGRQL